MSLTYSLVKLVGVFLLVALGIVALGLGWVTEVQGWAFIMALVGYVVGNVDLMGNAPLVSRFDQ